MQMGLRAGILAFVIATASAVSASEILGVAQEPPPVTVLIQCQPSEVKSGSEVKLFITVSNTSDQDVHLYKTPGPDGQAEDVNKIEVRDEVGNKLSRSDVQTVEIGGKLRTFPKKMKVSRKGGIVKPGESLSDFAVLSNLFDLSKPGHYTVTVRNERRSGDLGPEMKLIYASSNTITLTVVAADTSVDGPK